MIEQFANNAVANLASDIDDTIQTISVIAAEEFPPLEPFRIRIEEELLKVVNGAGTNTWTVERGIEDSTSIAHNNGTNVFQSLTVGGFAKAIRGDMIFGEASGSSNAYLIDLIPAPEFYSTGMLVNFQAPFGTTGSATINVNGLGVIPIKKRVSLDLELGDILLNQLVLLSFDGTNFQLMSRTFQGTGGGGSVSLFTNEDKTSLIDGIETDFSITNPFDTNSTKVYLNGIRIRLGDDYTESVSLQKIVIASAPQTGDSLVVDYQGV